MMGVNTHRSMGDSTNNCDALAGIMGEGKSRVEAMCELTGKARNGELKLLTDRAAVVAQSEQRALMNLIARGGCGGPVAAGGGCFGVLDHGSFEQGDATRRRSRRPAIIHRLDT